MNQLDPKRYEWITLGLLLALIGISCSDCHGKTEAKVERATGAASFNEAKVKDMTFEWKIHDEKLTVRVSAPTTGWVAVGFEPDSYMKGANLIITRVKGGKAEALDQYGDGNFSHKPDVKLGGKSNVSDVSGTEKGGSTQVQFTVPLDSGDKYDKKLAAGEKIKVMLSYGNTDDVTVKHAKHYLTEIKL
jgi:hypothetical protein